ncbi:opioid growth factor receptor-related protein [Glaesserella parasuis]|uniref:opioid growth factor receptor-related protein n=1 Tax=Glaesserella parasuis TaxID=738 RepID=UPI0024364366|nr:opioid growth factor receptor-related protein [Glaesserella parasuis]MDG6449443.1 opioid growth factor receptor-related protein [Glaesserella parasuis]MDO9790508.1 opioid growth factor receptor-related protein [Glaesserella parasuis]MDP0180850.1 opioid growth factor receptor-related protein [Glaesserella parasuis]MDP0189286.1 opioid growth factor receptor-related protein [Glaesserella parasuis]MDP0204094.1 opioid growth factor receptor-related protein [Glaesserella parasuis]
MSQILDFLEQKGTDHKGRTIQDIWAFDIFNLEHNHDFIQWIFPLDTPTSSNRFAPILSELDLEQIKKSQIAQYSLQKSLEVMLSFWGLKLENKRVIMAEQLNPNKINHFWIRSKNHNQLRITRVIKSLAILGQLELARQLQQGILEIAKNYAINPETIEFWRSALTERP